MTIANQINMSSIHEPRTSGLRGAMKGYSPKCLLELVLIEVIERGGHYLEKNLKNKNTNQSPDPMQRNKLLFSPVYLAEPLSAEGKGKNHIFSLTKYLVSMYYPKYVLI